MYTYRLGDFPGSLAFTASAPPSRGASSLRLRINVPDLPKTPSYALKPGLPTPGQHSFLRPPFAVYIGTGILTCFPSTTHFCLALGADSPCADYRCAGILGLSACGVFTRIIVTHVSIRTSDTSSNLFKSPSQAYRTLLYHPLCISTMDPTLRLWA